MSKYFILLTFLCCTITGSVHAQIEEIVVTAQKREELLSDVPISILAFDKEAIAMKRIESIDDLTVEIPGFVTFTHFRSQTAPALRGAGSIIDNPAVDQTVGIYIDGIYFAQPGHIAFDLFDLERIEVLRGPQGTLQGRNVIGGAINIITKTPGKETIVKGGVTVGSHGLLNVEALFSGALIEDTLAGQVAFASRYSDGYINNRITGNKLEGDDINSARGTLYWTPTDSVDAKLTFAYSVDKSFGSELNLVGSSGVIGDPVAGSLTDADDDVYLDMDGGIDRELIAVTGNVNIDSGIGTFTSVTGYHESHNSGTNDADGGSFPAIILVQTDRIDQFSQELRLTGDVNDFRYTVGAYYLNVEHGRREPIDIVFPPGTVVDFLGASHENVEINNKTDSYAVFADLSVDLNDKFTVIGGGRWSNDKKDFAISCTDPIGPIASCAVPSSYADSHSWDAFTWRAILQYRPGKASMTYASVARGFKSGGFSAGTSPPPATPQEGRLDPEFALSYELGAKLFAFDHRLSVNPAVFYTEYTDMQIIQFNTNTLRSVTSNAASAEVYGAELEIAANPTEGLDLFFSYAYLDSEYKDLVTALGDFTGNKMTFAPKHAVSVGVTYTVELSNGGTLRLNGDMLYKSNYFWQPSNDDPIGVVDLDRFFNASINYRLPNQKWSITLWGKNLTDVRGSTGGVDRSSFFQDGAGLAAGHQSIVFRGNPPLTWGIAVQFDL